DFFNYSGLHRPVFLTAKPPARIEDITVRTDYAGSTGTVAYEIAVAAAADSIEVRLLDEQGAEVARGEGAQGTLRVSNVKLWQPGAAYLYTLVASLRDAHGTLIDIYRLSVGVRTIAVTPTTFLI